MIFKNVKKFISLKCLSCIYQPRKYEKLQQGNKKVKEVVAKTKQKARIKFYSNLEMDQGEAEFCKAAKQRARAKKDAGKIIVIRTQGGDVTNQEKIKDKWAEYFHNILNEENVQYPLTQAASTEGPVLDVPMDKIKG